MSAFEKVKHRLDAHPNKVFGQGASEEDIQAAEAALGLPLVGAYRAFLRDFGWGGVDHLELYGLGADVPPYLHLVTIVESERHEMAPSLPYNLVPVMNDGAGNLYCIDTNAAGRPVVFWDHSLGYEQQPEVCAVGFAEWLEQQLDQL